MASTSSSFNLTKVEYGALISLHQFKNLRIKVKVHLLIVVFLRK